MRNIYTFALAAIVSMAATGAHAETVRLKATLTGADEVPAKQVSGTGNLSATLDSDTNKLTYHVEYQGLTGPATAAHLHGPAEAGTNAKPQIPIKQPVTSPLDGAATLTAEQAHDLLAGKWYFNVHTAANPSGEIRGQVVKEQ